MTLKSNFWNLRPVTKIKLIWWPWNQIFEIWHLWPKSNLYDDFESKVLKFDTYNRNHVYLMLSKSNFWNLTSVTGITVIWWPWNQIFENLKLVTALWLSNHFLKSETCIRRRSWPKTSFSFFDVKFNSWVKTVSGENLTVEYPSITVTIWLIVHLVKFESFELFS